MKQRSFQYSALLIAVCVFLFGCKTGGLMEMEKDDNKPLIKAEIKTEEQSMLIQAPIDMNVKLIPLPIEEDLKDFILKRENVTRNNDKTVCSITHVVFDKRIIEQPDYDEKKCLKLFVKEAVDIMQENKQMQDFSIDESEYINIGESTAQMLDISYKANGYKLMKKVVYIIKNNSVWAVCYDMEYNDKKAYKDADNSLKSIVIFE